MRSPTRTSGSAGESTSRATGAPHIRMIEDLRRHYIDLAQPRLGAEVVYATDDFFADKARLIDPAEPMFIPGKYDGNGKWMDGWESRRKRTPGHDWRSEERRVGKECRSRWSRG